MQTAIVTGASRGIGRAIVHKLCDQNWRVIGIARSEEDLSDLKSRYSNCFEYIVLDLARPESIRELPSRINKLQVDEINLLINNAGGGLYKKTIEHEVDEIEKIIYLNFIAPIMITRILSHLLTPGSFVVYVISAIIHIASKDLPVYGAAKIGLYYAVKIIREELKERGVHVIAIYPGYVRTDFHLYAGRPSVNKGLTPDQVADKIIEAIMKKKKDVYIPSWLKIAKILGPILPVI
ncbi:MAG: SDR family NAD(P)-dependent oxidoreductase [Desulfurococcaceae archaeon]